MRFLSRLATSVLAVAFAAPLALQRAAGLWRRCAAPRCRAPISSTQRPIAHRRGGRRPRGRDPSAARRAPHRASRRRSRARDGSTEPSDRRGDACESRSGARDDGRGRARASSWARSSAARRARSSWSAARVVGLWDCTTICSDAGGGGLASRVYPAMHGVQHAIPVELLGPS